MKFLYLTIVFLSVWLGLFFLLSALGMLWGNSYIDCISCIPWNVTSLLGFGVVAAFVVDEEAKRIDWKG